MVEAPVKTELILASSSPRRRQLLREAGYEFTVVVPKLEEPNHILPRLAPTQQAEALAYFKARAVSQTHPLAVVVGADTIVALDADVLGKPADESDARDMLSRLSGTRHAVITGMAVLCPGGERLIASETTYITMRKIDVEEIDEYIASGEWVGKAGAYAIQETADRFVEKVEGCVSNVVGLPMELLKRMLIELQEHPETHKVV